MLSYQAPERCAIASRDADPSKGRQTFLLDVLRSRSVSRCTEHNKLLVRSERPENENYLITVNDLDPSVSVG